MPGDTAVETVLARAGLFLVNTIGAGALVFHALRVRRLPSHEHAAARSLAFFAVGVGLFVAGNAESLTSAALGQIGMAGAASPALVFLSAVVAWTYAARGQHAALARAVTLLLTGIFTLALLLAALDAALVFPIGRVLGALLLSYAVMRGEFAGLDLKVRFAISKSTVAATFIAVFFVASETAQQFFGDRFESGYLGILAAGALVFAIAPLSRVADRLAEKAVPVASTPAGISSRKEETYRAALAVAMRDRRLTRDEEVHLHRLAEELGIGAGRAHELRVGVEGERPRKRRVA